jgi:hypothetical protein
MIQFSQIPNQVVPMPTLIFIAKILGAILAWLLAVIIVGYIRGNDPIKKLPHVPPRSSGPRRPR